MKKRTQYYLSLLLGLSLVCGFQSAQAGLFDLGILKDTAKKIKRASGKVPVEEEIRIGDSVCAQLLGAAPLVKQNALQQYVNRVGMWIAQQTDRKNLPWAFGVTDDDDINAFAAPGGRVLVTRGLFMSLENEAELAGVLGHEISHVILKHHLKAVKKNARFDLLGDALEYAAQSESSSDQLKLDALLNASTQLYARGLDRKDEYAADRMGVVLAARAGYDPYALLNVLATLDSINPTSRKIALITKTHPSFNDRLEQLDIAIEGKLDKYVDQPRLVDRIFNVQQQMTP